MPKCVTYAKQSLVFLVLRLYFGWLFKIYGGILKLKFP
jgi:uncharacterized membrane protein YphA (DoxX/SURF4 family)